MYLQPPPSPGPQDAVDALNAAHLRQLPGDAVVLRAADRLPAALAPGAAAQLGRLLADAGAPPEVELKVGAQVFAVTGVAFANGWHATTNPR